MKVDLAQTSCETDNTIPLRKYHTPPCMKKYCLPDVLVKTISKA
jgi:hypothetical protein